MTSGKQARYVPDQKSQRKTRVSIDGEDWLINGELTYKGREYRGWRIEGLSELAIADVGPAPGSLVVNRVVIRRVDLTQLVYYWFEQQGRVLTNEYLIKWYLLWDGMRRNRTDGALVRLVTQVPDPARMDQADRRLAKFVRAVYPNFLAYVPR